VSRDVGNGQLELLPAKVPECRRATLLLADLDGFEHAMPGSDLVGQIASLGLLQPIVVAGSVQRRYQVIEGRRRAKAVQLLAAEGRWPSPPRLDVVIVQGVDGAKLVPAGMMLALHASRGPSPASELRAIEAILAQGDEEPRTIKEIAAQTGMPVQTVRRRLRLRNLIPALRAAFDLGEISASIAEAAARLTAEQQAGLDKLLARGERLTLATIREITRERTETAAAELPDGLFVDREVPWQATVRGHLQSALAAIPADHREGALAAAMTGALTLLESGGGITAGCGDSPHGGDRAMTRVQALREDRT
jgi:ParB-like chromosome segregation protein Spo0J